MNDLIIGRNNIKYNELFSSPCDKDGAEKLTRTFKRFHTKMNTIYDELTASADDPDGEVDWEGLYERSQNAILTVRKKLSIVISIINEAMEEEFDD